MSWSFQLQRINRSFEQIASWFTEFMHRTERCFQALNERINILEERQRWQTPTDEQVERVLRKILAEKFSGISSHQYDIGSKLEKGEHFVELPNDSYVLKSIPIDIASLLVEPDAVPSKSYEETFEMLERRLPEYPDLDSQHSAHDDCSKGDDESPLNTV